jgi:predicted transcriptional regulator
MTPIQFRKAREKLGLSQSGLGAVLGLKQPNICRREHGKRRISVIVELAIECLLRRKGLWNDKGNSDGDVTTEG